MATGPKYRRLLDKLKQNDSRVKINLAQHPHMRDTVITGTVYKYWEES